jgi:hypothetical protein
MSPHRFNAMKNTQTGWEGRPQCNKYQILTSLWRCSSETLQCYITTLPDNPEDRDLNIHRPESHKYHGPCANYIDWIYCFLRTIMSSWITWWVSFTCTAQSALGYGLDDRGSRVRFSAGAGSFSLHHRVQNCSGAHPASCPMRTRGSFLGDKAAGAWSWPLTSI